MVNKVNNTGAQMLDSILGYSRKKYLGGEDGRQYIFLWVVGAEFKFYGSLVFDQI